MGSQYLSIEKLFLAPFGGQDDPPNDPDNQQSNPPPANQSDNTDKDKDDKDKDDEDDDDEFSGYSAKELKRIAKDLSTGKKKAESDRDSYKTKIDESERAKKTDLENLQTDKETLTKENATLRATNAKLAIVNAIICDNRYEWFNPEIVAQQLDSNIVKVSDEGKVEGLKKELDRVSKEHSYLLKGKGNQQQQQGPTGFQPGQQQQGGQGGAGSPDIKELQKTYPALASRM